MVCVLLFRLFSLAGLILMDISRDYHLRQTADTLYRLAEIVECSGLKASDIGRMLCEACEHSSVKLGPGVRRELDELRNCRTPPAQFAAGLRRQADFLRAKASAQVVPK